MTQLLVVILNDLDRLPALMNAWKRIGVPGVTLLQSVGGYQAETWLRRIGLGGISKLLETGEVHQRTLLSLIDDDVLLEQAIAEADEIVGGFDRPHSGILFSLPVGRVLGLIKWGQEFEQPQEMDRREEIEPGKITLSRTTPVSQIVDLLSLKPVIVPANATLEEIVDELFSTGNIQVVSVVNEEKRLVGLIDMTTLADALFFTIVPEEYLGELADLEKVLVYAGRTKTRRAADIMREPIWVRLEDSLEKAFHLVHQHKLTGVPVVNNRYHVIGYINLLELMLACLRTLRGVGEDAGGKT